jgi:cytochrome c oxidase subunit 4
MMAQPAADPAPDAVLPSPSLPPITHVAPVRHYLTIGAVLLGLLVLTLILAGLPLGPLGTVVALAIAIIKAGIVACFFMHLNTSSPLTRLVACAGLFWLGILLALTLTDYLTRP